MTYSIPGGVSALATKGPVRCIGPILIPTWPGSTYLSTVSTISNRRRARFSIEPPYSSVRRLVPIQELSDQIKVVRLDLHAVESCFQSILRRDAKIGYRLANFCFGHWAGSDSWLATRRGNAYLFRIHRRR